MCVQFVRGGMCAHCAEAPRAQILLEEFVDGPNLEVFLGRRSGRQVLPAFPPLPPVRIGRRYLLPVQTGRASLPRPVRTGRASLPVPRVGAPLQRRAERATFCGRTGLNGLRFAHALQLERRTTYEWTLQLLSALNHLHTRDPIILHRDLKARTLRLFRLLLRDLVLIFLQLAVRGSILLFPLTRTVPCAAVQRDPHARPLHHQARGLWHVEEGRPLPHPSHTNRANIGRNLEGGM